MKKIESGTLFKEFTNVWTRTLQIIILITFTFLWLFVIGLYVIPELGMTVMGNMTEAQAGNMFELVRMWAFPMLFFTLLLFAVTVFILKLVYKKTNKIVGIVREKCLYHHERSLKRKAAVAERKKNKGDN